MLISQAFAQEDAVGDIEVIVGEGAAAAPTAMSTMVWNMGLIVVLVVMFYVLLIMPQQKRFKEHKAMLEALKKGDRVVTSGGLVGTVDKMEGNDEVIVDLGNGVKVTALRHTIQSKADKK